MIEKIVVPKDIDRLDRFLAKYIEHISRTQIQKDIIAGHVTVNGAVILETKFSLKEDDIIEYSIIEKTQEKATAVDLDIVYETEDLLVINKPAGLVVHPAPGYVGPTLAQGLLQKYSGIHIVGDDEVRPGIVHRLDKDTSGVILVAKTQKMFEHLKDAFATRKIKKEYIALVVGHVPDHHGFISTAIGKHPRDFRKKTVQSPIDPKEAVTEYTVIEYLKSDIDEYTLLRVKLHTGRTHQIRVHFASLGFPLAGDTLYGKKTAPGLSRQFLHAEKIEVQLPDASWIEAHAPLPKDLMVVLNMLHATFTN